MKISEKELLKRWKEEFCRKSDKVDPCQEYTWEALFVGYAMAFGYTPVKASKIYNEKGYVLEGTKEEEDNE
jgi:uncharacterized protein with WD repeat